MLTNTLDQLEVINTCSDLVEVQRFSKDINSMATFLFKSFIKYTLCSKKVVLEYKLTKQGFQFLLEEIRLSFYKSRAHPGEMTGPIAA